MTTHDQIEPVKHLLSI